MVRTFCLFTECGKPERAIPVFDFDTGSVPTGASGRPLFVKPRLANETILASNSRTRFDFMMRSFASFPNNVL
jgi:hypothetical protein